MERSSPKSHRKNLPFNVNHRRDIKTIVVRPRHIRQYLNLPFNVNNRRDKDIVVRAEEETYRNMWKRLGGDFSALLGYY
eukprot:1155477-Prymnesium_polylepis.1